MATYPLLLGRRQGRPVHALRDRLREQLLLTCDEVQLDRRPACALPVDRDLARVAPEGRDMRPDPAQGHALILEAGINVAERRVLKELGCSEEADRVEAVVDGRDDDVRGLVDPVVERPVCGVPEYVA